MSAMTASSGGKQSRVASLVPFLAMLGAATAPGLGTSWAKQLFPIIGAQGITALREGLSALLLLEICRPSGRCGPVQGCSPGPGFVGNSPS